LREKTGRKEAGPFLSEKKKGEIPKLTVLRRGKRRRRLPAARETMGSRKRERRISFREKSEIVDSDEKKSFFSA